MRENIKKLSKLSLAMGLLACNGLVLAGQASIVADSTAKSASNSTAKSKVSVKHIAAAKDKKDEVERATVPVDNSNDTALLGVGYDSKAGDLKAHNIVYAAVQANGGLAGDNDGNGIDDGAVRMGNSKATVTFGVDRSFEQTLSLIEGNASVSVELPTVNAEGNVNLALNTAASSNIASYTLFARVEPKKAVWLAEEAVAGQAGSGDDMQPSSEMINWKNVVGTGAPLIAKVGDEFIQATEYSAWLMVNLKFEFHNAEDKKQIGGNLKVGYNGVVEVEGAASWAALENSQTVNVTFTAQQGGGVPTELTNVVPSNLPSCTLNAPEVCLSAFEDAINYMKNNFVTQFDNNANYNATRYYTSRYVESGPTLAALTGGAAQQRTFASDLAIRQMSSYWMQAKQDEQRADYLLAKQASYLSSAEQTAITAVKTKASQNATTLTNTINSCRVGTPDACDTAWTGSSQLQSYDASVLEIQR